MPNVIVKGLGRIFFPDNMAEKEIAESLAAKGQELLDMSAKARLARAKAQGFSDETLFHGTDAGEIEGFKNRVNRAGKDVPVFVAPSPALANRFADAGDITEGANLIPVKINVKNTFDFRNPEHLHAIKQFVSGSDMEKIKNGEWRAIESDETIEAIKGFGFDSFRVMEGSRKKAFAEADRTKSKIFADTREGKQEGSAFFADKIADWKERSGKNSLKPTINKGDQGFTVEFQGEEFKGLGERAEGSAGINTAIFDPSNIRSVNAAFDPARSKSSDLLASAAPVALGLGALGSGEEAEAGALSSFLKKAHPKLSISITERGNNIILDKVIVPKELRDSGQGSRFMEDLLSAADSQGRTIGLSPSTDFGGTKSGLQRFYKKHGFVPNKGKNRNFEISESLIRSPKGLLAGAAGIGATGQSFASQVQSRQGETPTEHARRLLVRPEDKITADEFPKLEAIGDFLDKYGQTPIGPAFEGIAQYLRDFGREDMNTKQRVKSAFMAALDVI